MPCACPRRRCWQFQGVLHRSSKAASTWLVAKNTKSLCATEHCLEHVASDAVKYIHFSSARIVRSFELRTLSFFTSDPSGSMLMMLRQIPVNCISRATALTFPHRTGMEFQAEQIQHRRGSSRAASRAGWQKRHAGHCRASLRGIW